MLLSFGLCTQQQALGCGLDQNTDLHSALHAPHAGPCFSKACQRTTLLAESATKATCRILLKKTLGEPLENHFVEETHVLSYWGVHTQHYKIFF